MAKPILDSEEFIDNLIKLIESHLQTIGGTYFTSCTYPPTPTIQPGLVNWTGYSIPSLEEFEEQQRENQEGGTPQPSPDEDEEGGETESKTDIDAIFVTGLTDNISFTNQVNTFKTAYGTSTKIESFRHEVSNVPSIISTLKANPKIPIFLFSAGCARIDKLIDNPNLDKTKVYLIEPYTVSNVKNIVESAIDKGLPARNVFVGPATSRGSNIARDTTKVPTGTGHLGALSYAANLHKKV